MILSHNPTTISDLRVQHRALFPQIYIKFELNSKSYGSRIFFAEMNSHEELLNISRIFLGENGALLLSFLLFTPSDMQILLKGFFLLIVPVSLVVDSVASSP